MVTIKSYSDLQQSKKLAEILPLESADMFYDGYKNVLNDDEISYQIDIVSNWTAAYPNKSLFEKSDDTTIPCWSLAVLEHIIWNTSVDAVSCPHIYRDIPANGYYVLYGNYETNTCPSMIDACYEMVLKLHELNLL